MTAIVTGSPGYGFASPRMTDCGAGITHQEKRFDKYLTNAYFYLVFYIKTLSSRLSS